MMEELKMNTKTMVKNIKKIGLEDYVTLPETEVSFEEITVVSKALGIERFACANLLFPQIDPAFLSIKHADTYDCKHRDALEGIKNFEICVPRFAVYTIDNPICALKITVSYEVRDKDPLGRGRIVAVYFESGLPDILNNNLFRSFQIKSEKYSFGTRQSESTLEFTSLFNGIIPEQGKQSIELAQKLFRDQVYLVTEATKWNVKTIPSKDPPTPIKDPLVIGIVGDECFLVDQFDCTTIEDYVRREFKK